MTLDGYALTGLFVVMFGFLAVSAYIFERAEPDPLTPDRRNQAHPFDGLTRPLVEDRMMASVLSGSPVVDPPPESAAAG